jgi:hypothetical protein
VHGGLVYWGHFTQVRRLPSAGGASSLVANSTSVSGLAADAHAVYWLTYAGELWKRVHGPPPPP